ASVATAAPKGSHAAAAPAQHASNSAAAQPGAPAEGTHKKLPKTASPVPLVGLTGLALCGLAMIAGGVRRRAFYRRPDRLNEARAGVETPARSVYASPCADELQWKDNGSSSSD